MSSVARTVLCRREEETWSAFLKRMQKIPGDILLIFSPQDTLLLAEHEADRKSFLYECGTLKHRLTIATKQSGLAAECRRQGIPVIDRLSQLRALLDGHPQLSEAVRLFSPQLWRQELRTRLQAIGLLSLPKLRIWVLILTSIILFLFVVFRLLPSAEVRVWPRQDTVSQTVNIYVVQSGAQLEVPPLVRKVELMPIKVRAHRTITFDEITEEFTGEPATVKMRVINTSGDIVTLRKGSRVVNKSGLAFRLETAVVLTASGTAMATAVAEDADLYGDIIGERGNVPQGMRWEFSGLRDPERSAIYAINIRPATGGTTSSRRVLQQKDIDAARKKLEAELLNAAHQMVDDAVDAYDREHPGQHLRIFTQDDDAELIRTYFFDTVLPTQFLGQPVTSVPLEGSLDYKVVAYDTQKVLSMMRDDIRMHIEDGKRLLDASLTQDRLRFTVIKFADDLTWVKGTADLTGLEEFIINPITPSGATFGRRLRALIVGQTREEAAKIIKNLPEVEKVEIRVWPPWGSRITDIPGNISIDQQ